MYHILSSFQSRLTILLIFLLLLGCGKEDGTRVNPIEEEGIGLSIFFINDPHSQLTNFAKIKYIIDQAKQETNVLLVAAGDIFSGSPYVDQFEEKGYPIIDVMNQTGFDIAVIGNHEFDYGIDVLEERINQSDFPWICANMTVQNNVLTQPAPYLTLDAGELTVTFLGLVETFGQPGQTKPATHPWRVADVSFEHYYDIIGDYRDLKTTENSNVYVALTHLGIYPDQWIAENYDFFDLIIGGHSNHRSTQFVDGTPTLMAGVNLSYLGRIDLLVNNKQVTYQDIQLIDLEKYSFYDEELMQTINTYQTNPAFDKVIGLATSYHNTFELGCFYTEALTDYLDVDLSFQNPGGIRSDLNQGEVTPLEIYSIDPFGNGTVIFEMTAAEIKNFFKDTGVGLHIHGVDLVREGNNLIMYSENGLIIPDEEVLRLGINDYIPAVYADYFSFEDAQVLDLTTAETLINFLETIDATIDYEDCNHYFQY